MNRQVTRMLLHRVAAAASLAALALSSQGADACTAIAVGNKASKNGAPMTTHTNDCLNCDWRISKVPAKTHPKGSKRPVIAYRDAYPRYYGDDYGETYKTVDKEVYDWKKTEPIGYIDQVEETYGYIEGQYGILNEHNLAIGESTCGGKLVSVPVHAGGNALFDVTQLSKVAMERCKTARCAVQTMGDLATEHGYYGAAWEGDMSNQLGEAGEALTITDPDEAWVFHIHPDLTGKSAVWVAQRVPDNHIAAVANQFVIRGVDLKDKDYFMGSDNLYSTAQEAGFWDPAHEFDFTEAYSMSRGNHSSYANRRVWRVFTLANPSLNEELSPITPVFSDYPFSVPVDDKLTAEDIIKMNRDHYEGTPFDTTLGVAAGPWGNPNRFDGGASYNGDLTGAEAGWGVFERPISMFRTTYSFVTQTRKLPGPAGPVVYFAVHAPHGAVYMPLYAASDTIPRTLTVGNRYKFNEESQFWVDMTVSNYMETRYLPMIGDVQAQQKHIETRALDMQTRVEEQAVHLISQGKEGEAKKLLEDFSHHNAETVREEWWDFFKFLVAKFHDGYRIDDFHAEYMNPTKLFYPKWWLESIDYFTMGSSMHDQATNEQLKNVKIPAGSAAAKVQLPEDAQLAPAAAATAPDGHVTMSLASVVVAVLGFGGVCVAGGLYMGSSLNKRREYEHLA